MILSVPTAVASDLRWGARVARAAPLALAVVLALLIVSITLAGLVGILLAAPPAAEPDPDQDALSGGHRQPYPAPEFSAPTADKRTLRLTQLRGRYVLLNFWATWCGPCVEEMPSLQRLQEELGPERLVVLGVAEDADGRRLVAPFLRKNAIRFPVVLDPLQSISRRYGVSVLPVTFLISPGGQVLAIARGGRDWAAPNTLRYLTELLKAHPAP